jgi:hypothetical protein
MVILPFLRVGKSRTDLPPKTEGLKTRILSLMTGFSDLCFELIRGQIS